MNISFRQLRVFAEIARHGSMARAAEAFRYFMIERGEAHLRAHDEARLGPSRGAG